MVKNRFDSRTLAQVVEFLKSERTGVGDSITLVVKYNGMNKPNIKLEFVTTYPELAHLANEEDLSDWVPETFKVDFLDDFGREIDSPSYEKLVSSWPAYIDKFVKPAVESIVTVGARKYFYKDLK